MRAHSVVRLQHGKLWGWGWPTSLRRQLALKGCSLCRLAPQSHLSSPSSRIVWEGILSRCSLVLNKKWTWWWGRPHAHGGLVSSSQNNDADFQVTSGSRAGVISVAQQEPFSHYGMTWDRKRSTWLTITNQIAQGILIKCLLRKYSPGSSKM